MNASRHLAGDVLVPISAVACGGHDYRAWDRAFLEKLYT
jgi:hypothetical protein